MFFEELEKRYLFSAFHGQFAEGPPVGGLLAVTDESIDVPQSPVPLQSLTITSAATFDNLVAVDYHQSPDGFTVYDLHAVFSLSGPGISQTLADLTTHISKFGTVTIQDAHPTFDTTVTITDPAVLAAWTGGGHVTLTQHDDVQQSVSTSGGSVSLTTASSLHTWTVDVTETAAPIAPVTGKLGHGHIAHLAAEILA